MDNYELGIRNDELKEPQIRFKGFSDEWEEKTLCNLATMHARIGWQNLRTSEFLDDGDYYLITGTDFINGQVDFENCHYIDEDRYKQDPKIQLDNDSILITKDGTLGKVALVRNLDKPATLNAGVFNVKVIQNRADVLFLFQYLKAPYLMNYVNSKATGGTIKHLNQNILVDFPIIHPNEISEQTAIGSFFKTLDSRIEAQGKKIEKLSAMKKALLAKMFPSSNNYELGITNYELNKPQIRFKGFSDAWEEKTIADLCSISTGKSNTQDKVDEGNYDFYVRSPIIEKSDKYLYDEEAVLTVGDGVGTGKVFHYVNGKYDLHQRVYRMFDFNENMSAKFFYRIFSKDFNNRVMAMTAKTSVDSVRYEMIADMKLKFPTLPEQTAIGSFFKKVDELIALSNKELEQLKNIKSALLEKMFV